MDVYVYDCLALQQVVLVLELVSGTRLSSSIALLYNSMWVAYALLYNQTILCLSTNIISFVYEISYPNLSSNYRLSDLLLGNDTTIVL